MKSAEEWASDIIGDSPELWGDFPKRVRLIQRDSLLHAAFVITELARGDEDNDRAIAIDDCLAVILNQLKSDTLSNGNTETES